MRLLMDFFIAFSLNGRPNKMSNKLAGAVAGTPNHAMVAHQSRLASGLITTEQ
jgi:hypothetical protein